jgi:hypothetical protein
MTKPQHRDYRRSELEDMKISSLYTIVTFNGIPLPDKFDNLPRAGIINAILAHQSQQSETDLPEETMLSEGHKRALKGNVSEVGRQDWPPPIRKGAQKYAKVQPYHQAITVPFSLTLQMEITAYEDLLVKLVSRNQTWTVRLENHPVPGAPLTVFISGYTGFNELVLALQHLNDQ